MELIEKSGEFASRFGRWNSNDDLNGYPWVENVHAPFTPVRRALLMLNLGLVSSAGAYIDGTELDFVREGLNEGFRFSNPNERDRCGCGESFRV